MTIEDFTTYTEVDGSGVLTVTSSKITGVNVDEDIDAFVYDDKGVDNFDQIDIDFEIQIESASLNLGRCGPALTVSAVGTVQSFGTTDVTVLLQKFSSGATWRIRLIRGVFVTDDQFVAASGTLYYCSLLRSAGSTTITLEIYSDSGRTTLLDTLSVSGYGTGTKYRYLYGITNNNTGGAGRDWDGFVQNMEDILAAPPAATFVPKVMVF